MYWFLLVYIMAALIWWFISLLNKTREISLLQQTELRQKVDSLQSPFQYSHELTRIRDLEARQRAKYVGEGVTFLGIIIIGAVFVFRAVRRQIKLQQQQQHFVMAVTHELKTPIAIARLNLETLLKHKLDDEKQKKLLSMTLQETDRLNTLTNNILITAQLEGGGYNFSSEKMDISGLVDKTIRDFSARFPQRIFQSQVEDGLELEGDPFLIQLLLNNLIENAIKYSPIDGRITVSLTATGERINLMVADEGPGIPDDEKERVFDKFYRVGNENTRVAKGTGLGLFLCKKIAADHRALISVNNNTPTGAKFEVSFFQ